MCYVKNWIGVSNLNMLKSLHIQNFAIIETLELEFFTGLSVLTGETGAGKSIIIDAIGLVLGDRADINSIRADKDSAEIILIIDTPTDSVSQQWLQKHDFATSDDCILRRVIRRDGKSRAYINNVPVPLKTLKELGEQIIVTPEEISEYYEENYKGDTFSSEGEAEPENLDEIIIKNLRREKLEEAYKPWIKNLQKRYTIQLNKSQIEKITGS